MHILYYGRNVLDLHGLSTGVSAALLLGAGYGFVRFVADLFKGIGRADWRPVWRRRE